MDEEQAVLNDTVDSPATEGENMGDIDFAAEEPQPEPAPENAPSSEKVETKSHEESVPYERFQEVNEKLKGFNEYRQKTDREKWELQQQLKELANKFESMQSKPEPPKPDFTPIQNKTVEEIQDMIDSNPIELFSTLAKQINWEQKEAMSQELQNFKNELIGMGQEYASKEQYNAAEKVARKYIEDNPEFDAMMRSGEIPKAMNENPLYMGNPVAVYEKLMADKKQDEAIAAAIKEAEEKWKANRQTITKAEVLPAGGGANPSGGGANDKLKDTSKHGGAISVIADMIRNNRRRAANGG